jgi:hypothetical protein
MRFAGACPPVHSCAGDRAPIAGRLAAWGVYFKHKSFEIKDIPNPPIAKAMRKPPHRYDVPILTSAPTVIVSAVFNVATEGA